MKKIVILGAGQMGRAAALLINKNGAKLLAFGDNTERGDIDGTPVCSMEDALAYAPNLILIAVAGEERAAEIEIQARRLGYGGKILKLRDITEAVDIRKATAMRLAKRVESVPGAAAELGVFRGEFAALLNTLFPKRKLYLFDTFEGFDGRDVKLENEQGFSAANIQEFADTAAETVLARMPYRENVIIHKGYFPETAAGIEDTFVFVSLDADLYAPTLSGLEWFLPRMSPGGIIVLHDYNNPRFAGVKSAVEDYELRHGRLPLVPLCDVHGSAVIVKS